MTVKESIVYSSFIGDALSLGAHWIYNQQKIDENPGKTENYSDPMSDYHPGKKAGDLTHYGDQTLVLLSSIAKTGKFDLNAFADDWRAFWDDPNTKSYRDGATKETLKQLASGCPPLKAASESSDIAGAARIAPLFTLSWESDDGLVQAARIQTALTHSRASVVEAAEFFARVVMSVEKGESIQDALSITSSLKQWEAIPETWYIAAKESSLSSEHDSAVAKIHGMGCDISEAFPMICHLLIRHPDNLQDALIANANAGGDSAARGMIIGMVHGARTHKPTIPEKWMIGLRAKSAIHENLDKIINHD